MASETDVIDTPAPDTPPQPSFPFFDLPAELRNHVYGLLMKCCEQRWDLNVHYVLWARRYIIPSMRLVSRAIKAEYEQETCRATELRFITSVALRPYDGSQLRPMFGDLPAQIGCVMPSIQRIELAITANDDLAWYAGLNAYYILSLTLTALDQLLAMMPKLRHVALEIHAAHKGRVGRGARFANLACDMIATGEHVEKQVSARFRGSVKVYSSAIIKCSFYMAKPRPGEAGARLHILAWEDLRQISYKVEKPERYGGTAHDGHFLLSARDAGSFGLEMEEIMMLGNYDEWEGGVVDEEYVREYEAAEGFSEVRG
ncbi:hypothetical protein LTR86_004611 [Recurvomyces mirabilis]|nr:hypothetical protein LTR86_004611 [Recurvomyces mirabilis]